MRHSMLFCTLLLLSACLSLAEIREPEDNEGAKEEESLLKSLAASPATTPPAAPPPIAIVPASPSPAPLDDAINFDAQGHVVDAPSRRAASLQIDAWMGYLTRYPDIALGFGFVLHDGLHFRPSFQIGNGVAGFGFGWRLIPVIELTVGVGALWSVQHDAVEPSVFISFAHW